LCTALQQKRSTDVRFGSKADIEAPSIHVRFTSESGHQRADARRPLGANSGQTRPHESPTDLMSPTRTYIGILHRDSPPSSINLTRDAGTNASALGLINVAMYVELGNALWRRPEPESAHALLASRGYSLGMVRWSRGGAALSSGTRRGSWSMHR